MSVTIHALATAERNHRRATERAREALRKRDALVHEALAAGWTHQQIRDATGLSRGRIGQIAMKERTNA